MKNKTLDGLLDGICHFYVAACLNSEERWEEQEADCTKGFWSPSFPASASKNFTVSSHFNLSSKATKFQDLLVCQPMQCGISSLSSQRLLGKRIMQDYERRPQSSGNPVEKFATSGELDRSKN